MPSLKERMKDMSFWEKKREKERQITEVMESTDENDPNTSDATRAVPAWKLKWAQFGIAFVYGIISMSAIFALACYLLDMGISTFGGDFGDYIDYILLIVVVFTIGGSILGCCLTFKYGTVSTNIKRLQNQTHKLRDKVDGFTAVQELLQEEVGMLKDTLYGISVEKNQLLKCVDKFDTLSATLAESGSMGDDFLGKCDEMCDDLWNEYEKIKLQTQKTDLLKLFYDKQVLDDNDNGLNRNEFEYLMFDLDDDMKDKFPPFDEFDENQNGIIEIFEFESVLDSIYGDMLRERKEERENKIQNHYRNRNQENDTEREERRDKIDREQKKAGSRSLSAMRKIWK